MDQLPPSGVPRSRTAAEVVATWIRQMWSQGAVVEAGKDGEITTASNKSFAGFVLAIPSLINGFPIGWIIVGVGNENGWGGVASVFAGVGALLGILGVLFGILGLLEVNNSARPMYGRETSGIAIVVGTVGAVLSGLQILYYFSIKT